MQVGDVVMGVFQLAVPMEVRVPHTGGQPRMDVIVMAVVVTVAVQVLDRGMGVCVFMPPQEEEHDAQTERPAGGEVPKSEWLVQEDEGERRAEERSARERYLSARRAQVVGRNHVQDDADAVRQAADDQG